MKRRVYFRKAKIKRLKELEKRYDAPELEILNLRTSRDNIFKWLRENHPDILKSYLDTPESKCGGDTE